MSWLGAGLGAGIGMALGGPIGAAAGALIGSAIGNKKYSKTEENQMIFFVTLCSMLAKMAKADGIVSKSEISTVKKIFDELGLDKEDRKVAISIFNNAKNDNKSIYEYAEQYSECVNVEMREMLYAILWEVAMADKKLHKREEEILKKIPLYLKISEKKFSEFKANITGDSLGIDECYEILGCSPTDTHKAIKERYRKLIAEYHPDKIISKGLPENFIKFADEQTKKINEAYNIIIKSKK